HYYWDRLVRDSGELAPCRATFGDDTRDYDEALRAHYQYGAPANWQESFVSAYATSHPWEDFAETWAHYFHIVDTLEMARAFGVDIHPRVEAGAELETHIDFQPYRAQSVEQLVDSWLPLTFALNSINRSMGQPDLYPFILTPTIVGKLGFVQGLCAPPR
ncbi:MAG TPA: putative zinc-binding metallopeptidase, partial [Roseiarcus sp.]